MKITTPEYLQSGVLGINHEFTLNSANPDEAFPIPARLAAMTFSCYLDGGGEYEVLVTTDKPSSVAAGTMSAGWFSLGGPRTSSAQVTIPAKITHVRFVRISGTIKGSFYST